jgi:hypothetical protein
MTSITVNLTLEQVLEFVQNLPLEYKKAVKEKLENEKVEKVNQNEIIDSTISDENKEKTIEEPKKSLVDEITGIIKVDNDNMPDYKTMRNEAIIARYKDKEERADREEQEREREKNKEAEEIAERRAIVESLAGKWKLPNDFDYKEEYRKLITKKYK